jgi:hypothetical protein
VEGRGVSGDKWTIDIPFDGGWPDEFDDDYPVGLKPMSLPPLPPVPPHVLFCWMAEQGLIPASCFSAGIGLPRGERVCLCAQRKQ